MDRFGAIKEMALSSTETISISRQDDRGKQDKLTLGAPQPKKERDFSRKQSTIYQTMGFGSIWSLM